MHLHVASHVRIKVVFAISVVAALHSAGGGSRAQQPGDLAIQGPLVSERVAPKVLETNLRELTQGRIVRPWQPGDPIRIIPRREVPPEYDQPPQSSEATSPEGPVTGGASASEPAMPHVLHPRLQDSTAGKNCAALAARGPGPCDAAAGCPAGV